MARFESLNPDPGPYTVEVNGETRQISPSPDADRIVIDTTTQETTEYQTATADIGTSYTESSNGGSRNYNPKSFGPAAQQWHKEVRNLSVKYELIVSAFSRDGGVVTESSWIDVELLFSDRSNTTVSERISVTVGSDESGGDRKSENIDVGDGTLDEIRINGAGPRTDYASAANFNIARVSFTADVPVESPQVTLNDVSVIGGNGGGIKPDIWQLQSLRRKNITSRQTITGQGVGA